MIAKATHASGSALTQAAPFALGGMMRHQKNRRWHPSLVRSVPYPKLQQFAVLSRVGHPGPTSGRPDTRRRIAAQAADATTSRSAACSVQHCAHADSRSGPRSPRSTTCARNQASQHRHPALECHAQHTSKARRRYASTNVRQSDPLVVTAATSPPGRPHAHRVHDRPRSSPRTISHHARWRWPRIRSAR